MTAPSRHPNDRPRLDRHRTLRQPITFGPVWARMLAACPPGGASAQVVQLCELWLAGRPGWHRLSRELVVPRRRVVTVRRPAVAVARPVVVVPVQRTPPGVPAAVFIPAPGRVLVD